MKRRKKDDLVHKKSGFGFIQSRLFASRDAMALLILVELMFPIVISRGEIPDIRQFMPVIYDHSFRIVTGSAMFIRHMGDSGEIVGNDRTAFVCIHINASFV